MDMGVEAEITGKHNKNIQKDSKEKKPSPELIRLTEG
tara:strand:- start:7861 stop:7971 length:111 start_codon:yes stop_codon:yes gene_type:complete